MLEGLEEQEGQVAVAAPQAGVQEQEVPAVEACPAEAEGGMMWMASLPTWLQRLPLG